MDLQKPKTPSTLPAALDILALTESLYGLAVAQAATQQCVAQEDMAALREAKIQIDRAKAVKSLP